MLDTIHENETGCKYEFWLERLLINWFEAEIYVIGIFFQHDDRQYL